MFRFASRGGERERAKKSRLSGSRLQELRPFDLKRTPAAVPLSNEQVASDIVGEHSSVWGAAGGGFSGVSAVFIHSCEANLPRHTSLRTPAESSSRDVIEQQHSGSEPVGKFQFQGEQTA